MVGEAKMQFVRIFLFILFISLLPASAHAYVGPGLGIGTIGVILGIIGSLFVAIFAIIWYPLKRLLKKNSKAEQQKDK